MIFYPQETDFIDIHSHNPEREEGVFRIYNVFTSVFPQIPTDIPISIGLHPWHLTKVSILEMPAVLEQAVRYSNLLAIGEAGIDRVMKSPVEEQLSVFRTHIEFCEAYKKPLIIHCVKAYPELLHLRKEFRNATPWIIHGFNAGHALAAECIKLGIYISLGNRLLRNPEKAEEIVKVVPLSIIFAETDDDPVSVKDIYNNIANLYSLSISGVKRTILENFKRVFAPT